MKKDSTLLKDFEKAAKALRIRYNFYCGDNYPGMSPIKINEANGIAKKTMVIINEQFKQDGFQKYLVQRMKFQIVAKNDNEIDVASLGDITKTKNGGKDESIKKSQNEANFTGQSYREV